MMARRGAANGAAKSVAPPEDRSSLDNELSRLDQGLADLRRCDAAEVCLIRCESETEQFQLVARLTRRARQNGVVTATLSLRQHSLEALDDVVRHLVGGLAPPTQSGTSQKRGLMPLLDAFASRHGSDAAGEFADRAARVHAVGDLTLLAQRYLEARDAPSDALMALNAWLGGTELSRRATELSPRQALSPKNARKALSELTRIVRALGFSGSVLFLTEGETLAHRTPRQREKAYIVLRELIDNFDSGHGTTATRLVLTGCEALFEGPHSIGSIEPLLGRLRVPSAAQPAPPHRSWVALGAQGQGGVAREPSRVARNKTRALRALIRLSQGLPPTEGVASLSVGHERIDSVIDRLFEHVSVSGSVFSVLTGDYGTGKTHLLMHLTERALDDGHPVFRLDLERLNFDLGNPQRHLPRLLDQSVLPMRHRPSALDRVEIWTRSAAKVQEVRRALGHIAEADTEAASAARRALRQVEASKEPERALAAFLSARGLENKPGAQSYRQDAYERFLLWLELLSRLDGCRGPVVLIDEAENLYAGGVSRSARRTALRSLSFYCGGALPSACVVIAITPKILKELRTDCRELLREVTEQRTVLEWEDATMLSRRLYRIRPEPVPEFTDAHRRELIQRVVETHRSVRGPVEPLSKREVTALVKEPGPPRRLLRCVVDELERRWWQGVSG